MTPSARIGRNYDLHERVRKSRKQQQQQQRRRRRQKVNEKKTKKTKTKKRKERKEKARKAGTPLAKPSLPRQKLPLWMFDDTYNFGVSQEEALLREDVSTSSSKSRLGWCYAFLKSNDPHVASREMWARCRIESFSSERQQYNVTFDGRMKLARESVPEAAPAGVIFAFAVREGREWGWGRG